MTGARVDSCFLLPSLKATVVYVHVVNSKQHVQEAERFVETYLKFPPGYPHDTCVVCNCGAPTDATREIFKPLPGLWYLQHDNTGKDLGGFIAASKGLSSDLAFYCGANVYFFKPGWLDRLVEARVIHGPGLYGTSASWQEMPHLNTTAFACDPRLLVSYPRPMLVDQDRYTFEQNRQHPDWPFWMYVFRLGQKAMLVTWDGEYDWWDWRKPPNIFRRGDQTNMLCWWRFSDHWRDLAPEVQVETSRITDTLTLNQFDPRTFPKSINDR